jgi:hypothetical protein
MAKPLIHNNFWINFIIFIVFPPLGLFLMLTDKG